MLFTATEAELENLKRVVNNEERPVRYLAIDPGKSNGICGYDGDCKIMMMWTVMEENVLDFLNQFDNLERCIIEDFLLYSNKAFEQVGSNMLTSRVIGRVEGWAARKDIPLTKQKAAIKPTGYRFIGKKPLHKQHRLHHALDAHVHFIYWAVGKGLVKAGDLLNNKTPEHL
jgi:hypothetical protein